MLEEREANRSARSTLMNMEYLNEEDSPRETIVANDHHKDTGWGMM